MLRGRRGKRERRYLTEAAETLSHSDVIRSEQIRDSVPLINKSVLQSATSRVPLSSS